jgi:hypothetical protein
MKKILIFFFPKLALETANVDYNFFKIGLIPIIRTNCETHV